jgi:hypothetical protein
MRRFLEIGNSGFYLLFSGGKRWCLKSFLVIYDISIERIIIMGHGSVDFKLSMGVDHF